MSGAPAFDEFIAIDWSGQAIARPPGLAVARAVPGRSAPRLVREGERWSRQQILDWLLDLAKAGRRALIGLDLSPAFPYLDQRGYFPGWRESPPDARALWERVDSICAADPHLAATSFVAHPVAGGHFRRHRLPSPFEGPGRFRLCEQRQFSHKLRPSSCFNLIGAAQVGKSSLTGMRVLHRLGGRIPVWPFDSVPEAGPVIVEIYTTIAARAGGVTGGSKVKDAVSLDKALGKLASNRHARLTSYTDHNTDAMITAAWMRIAAGETALWHPQGLEQVAQTEGWTFGAG
ncbi:hypothetical protein ACFQ1E_16195 [Sphingomonas canadensis]|uniref:DUF429 domain-containing protein n=1 Tax=Sphingomonas canadensis TaxID=1219257 RepID=A0ABW3H8V6_9SPHN|nr:hypothetical protein [Sphingomonas canadensis]MCW3837587.1 hypothetical protein [Sphingomonas canadensis]